MTESGSVLMVGRDAFLIGLRQRVLESAGYRVATVDNLDEIGQRLAVNKTSLLIICHTVPASELEFAQSAAACHAPPVPLLLLETGPSAFLKVDSVHSFDVCSGPFELLAVVASLMLTGPRGPSDRNESVHASLSSFQREAEIAPSACSLIDRCEVPLSKSLTG